MDPRHGESMCERCAVYKQLLDSSAELIQTIIFSKMVGSKPRKTGRDALATNYSV